MGIKNLRKFLEKRSNSYDEIINLRKYKYKKIAIDISPYLYKYKAISEYWLTSFINMVICIRKNDVHCVFIYDSKPPEEKRSELESRTLQKEKLKNKIINLEVSLQEYYNTGEVNDNLKAAMKDKKNTRTLLQEYEQEGNINNAEKELKKIKNQLITLTEKDIKLTKKFLTLMKVPWFNAPDEAERFCSQLCVKGIVDAVLSEDTDVLAYGTPVFLSKININSGICHEIRFENILSLLNFENLEQFQDFCIMCGTDYNSNIFKIGSEKAYSLLLQHQSIENIAEKENIDITILNHIKVRELFSVPEIMNTSIMHCKKPDFVNLQKFLFKNNIKMNINNIQDSLSSKVIFE